MTYTYHTLQDWNGNDERWPSQVFIERNEDGFETRKLVVHTEGGISYATDGMQQGRCYLRSDAYVPSSEPDLTEGRSAITPISQTEFERTWRSLVLHPVDDNPNPLG